MKRNKSIFTLMHKHEQQTIKKIKDKSKGREMQPQDNTKMCYQRKNQSHVRLN